MIWDAITSIIPWELIAAALGAVVALVAAWVTGRRSASQKAKIKDLESYQKTRKAMTDAENDLGDDPAVLREWMRERGKSKRDL